MWQKRQGDDYQMCNIGLVTFTFELNQGIMKPTMRTKNEDTASGSQKVSCLRTNIHMLRHTERLGDLLETIISYGIAVGNNQI